MTNNDHSHKDQEHNDGSRILIVTAVDAEKDAVVRGLAGSTKADVIAAGVGPAYAAASTAAALAAAAAPYRLVISAGIGGGFDGTAAIGSLVVADRIIAADLGAESQDGFISVDELGFGTARLEADSAWSHRFYEAIRTAGLEAVLAPILTVSTATGTAATAAAHAARIPGAAAEGMEGYGVAVAAQRLGIPFTELRAISNAVGPRDRAAWRIGEALASLEAASAAILEVLE
ncbi:futalosine hydrolase [Paenibacillus harenae]|uniref:futalosine hydrolase n=1 Tax=Paenibacillus harenae TaxID=306543 RepID=UPI0027921810|nr:futalosine hydrolase [Paenibacillus harenae]MDQ0061817.1 futalosine hydrolase [Paenibacillus harenae]